MHAPPEELALPTSPSMHARRQAGSTCCAAWVSARCCRASCRAAAAGAVRPACTAEKAAGLPCWAAHMSAAAGWGRTAWSAGAQASSGAAPHES